VDNITPTPPWRWTQLVGAGFTDGELRRRLRSGELARVRPGAYVPSDARLEDPLARHRLLITAALLRTESDATVSHVSAAVLHRLPVWEVPLDRVQLTRARRTSGRVGRMVHLHTAPLLADEVCMVGGVAVTSAARTVVDLARTLPFEPAVVLADAALHRQLVDRRALAEALRRARGWQGAPAARRVMTFADGRADGVGESRSRVAMVAHGIPAPCPQWTVRTPSGEFVGRADFGWPELATVGEFDGRVKYGRSLRPGQDPAEVVYQEKLREDAIRACGWWVARWTWGELPDFASVATRLRRGFSAAA
jgi:hypothetical protein